MCPACSRELNTHSVAQRERCTRRMLTPRLFNRINIELAAEEAAGRAHRQTVIFGLAGVVAVRVKVAWWAWLALGVLHWRIARRLRLELGDFCPASCSVVVACGPFAAYPDGLRVVRL